MPYAYIIAALALFGAGFTLSHQLDKANIQELQIAIANGNVIADNLLQAQTALHTQHAAEQQIINQQRDTSYAQTINTVNSLYDQLATKRLYDPGKPHGCSPAGPNTNTPVDNDDATGADGLSAEAANFLRAEAKACEMIAHAHNFLLSVIKEDNCGVRR